MKSATLKTLMFQIPVFIGSVYGNLHLAVTDGGRVFILFFPLLSPPSNFLQCWLPFLQELKLRTHLGYCAVNTQ